KPPVAVGRLLRFGVAALVVGAVLMLCGSIGAFHLWKVSDKNVKLNLSFMRLNMVKFDENSLTWVAADRPLKNSSFLSTKILDLCGDLPIFWLQTTYSKDGERRTRDTQRAKRQFDMKEFEAAAEEKNTVSHAENSTSTEEEEEGEEGEGRGLGRKEGAMTFDPILDHQGIFCSECRHSYTHYILPCRWWVACILGVVSVVHAHFLKPNSPKVLKVMFCKQQCHLYADIYCRTLYLVANTG
uniref:Chondromodulin n=1 Tax=Oncorhynchus tshawytscha TaxID=74940 RepID=A0A8C8HV63_ONCTS